MTEDRMTEDQMTCHNPSELSVQTLTTIEITFTVKARGLISHGPDPNLMDPDRSLMGPGQNLMGREQSFVIEALVQGTLNTGTLDLCGLGSMVHGVREAPHLIEAMAIARPRISTIF